MTNRRVLLHTGPLVALLAENDAYHRQCVETLAELSPPLLTCWPVLTEAAWILRRYPHPADRLNDARSAGLFDILPLNADDLPAIAAVMRRYEDTGLQFADAALAHLAERENSAPSLPPTGGISRSSASSATACSNCSGGPMSDLYKVTVKPPKWQPIKLCLAGIRGITYAWTIPITVMHAI